MANRIHQTPLPPGVTLQVYDDQTLIFSSGGKWLMPIFDLEEFLSSYTGPRTQLSAHDTAIGKAAAVMMVRLGVTRIHANLVSDRAKDYIDRENALGRGRIDLSWDRKIPQLQCATEDLLDPMVDRDAMYHLLRRRAKLIRGVAVSVDGVTSPFGAIHRLSFTVPAGGNLLIVGENGSGKTTLLRHLTGRLLPREGQVAIDGVAPQDLAPRTIGYVPQQHDNKLFPLSVDEVVSLGVRPGDRNLRTKVQKALGRTGCSHLRGRSYASLSGGEKQKVSLARCLAQEARVLLLDEPTSALDEGSRDMVAGILKSLMVTEIPTIISVTHDARLVEALGWETLPLGSAS